MPVFGDMILKSLIARISLIMGNLSSAGVNLLESIEIAKQVSNNDVVTQALENVKKELLKSDELKYWFFATTSDEEINKIYSSLRYQKELDSSNYTSQVFIIDKQRNQRGRIDDRDDDQIEKNIDLFGLYSYNSIIVSEIKKKMNDDIRILFTEYRQKRKGNFNSNIRRISNLDGNDK